MMKIQGYGVNGINPYKNTQAKNNVTKQSNVSFQDHIEISTKAKDLQGVKTYATERAERVAQLKTQIQDGTYQVDSKKLAQDMLTYFRR